MANKFTIGDFIHSDEANRLRINNTPGVDERVLGKDASRDNVLTNAQWLFKRCLNPLKLEIPNLAISSGFRCKILNYEVGGVSYSNHLYGEAADIYDPTGEYSSKEIFEWILKYVPKFYQVIWEFPERGKSRIKSGGTLEDTKTHTVNSWVHIAYVHDDFKNNISLASKNEIFHASYKAKHTTRTGVYTHDLNPGQFDTLLPLRTITPPIVSPIPPPSTLSTTGLSTTGGTYFGG